MNLCLLLMQPQRTFPFNHRNINVSSCCLPHFLLLLFCQSDHRVPGELWAASQPGHWEERLPGERAGWEGVSPGVGTEVKGWSSRWLLATGSLTHHCGSSLLFICLLELVSFHSCAMSVCVCFWVFFTDLRQELAVRERQSDVSRMSAPSSPTQDGLKMDSAVQASLSLPATPLSKSLDNTFANQTGRYFLSASHLFLKTFLETLFKWLIKF